MTNWNTSLLPNKGEWVLVTDGKYMSVGQLNNGEWVDINCNIIADVTHWAKLPDQPRSENNKIICPQCKRIYFLLRKFSESSMTCCDCKTEIPFSTFFSLKDD